MMIEGFEQPESIVVSENIVLKKYYAYYRKTLKWYQDKELCRQVDNVDTVYDLKKLKGMYHYLNKHGECYYIKYLDKGRWRLVGDISIWDGMIAAVICHEYQNRHIGRAAILSIIERAKEVGWVKVDAEIYDFNTQSQKAFQVVGFRKVDNELYRYELL